MSLILAAYYVVGFLNAVFASAGVVCSSLALLPVKRWRAFDIAARNTCWILAPLSIPMAAAYFTEFAMACASGNVVESWVFYNRAFGPLGIAYWLIVTWLAVLPNALWFPCVRRHRVARLAICGGVLIGLKVESFIAAMTLHRDTMPSMWSR
ncbi:MAG: hypothetical protein AAGB00_00530 [Planctomycetota bacterium]